MFIQVCMENNSGGQFPTKKNSFILSRIRDKWAYFIYTLLSYNHKYQITTQYCLRIMVSFIGMWHRAQLPGLTALQLSFAPKSPTCIHLSLTKRPIRFYWKNTNCRCKLRHLPKIKCSNLAVTIFCALPLE